MLADVLNTVATDDVVQILFVEVGHQQATLRH